jgi:hypothetical protein
MAVAIPLLAATLTATAPSSASAAACTWKVVPSPNVGAADINNELNGVAKVSPSDVWAVGFSGGNTGQTLVEHWNGSSWAIVPSPDPGGAAASSALNAVTAVSATNIWAVGTYYGGQALQTLVEHWDGTSWAVVPSPDPNGASHNTQLTGVAAVSASDIWAVGESDRTFGPPRTVIERWNGTTWRGVSSPNRTYWSRLYGVAATSSGSAWEVGLDFGLSGNRDGLIERWDGTRWQTVRTVHAALTGVSAVSGRDAWAVGGRSIYHWNGAMWQRVPSAIPAGDGFWSVAATSTRNAWAVGDYSGSRNVIDHWNGTSWQVAASPQPGQGDFLRGVAGTAHDVWAVGGYQRSSTSITARTLIMSCR